MRIPKFKKKFIAGALAAGLVMGAGGIAAAYLTASGSGTGTVTITSPSVDLSGTVAVTALTTTTTIPITVHNTTGGTVHVGIVTITITSQSTDCYTKATVSTATVAIGNVGTGVHQFTGTKAPKIKIAKTTTATHTQNTCAVDVSLSSAS